MSSDLVHQSLLIIEETDSSSKGKKSKTSRKRSKHQSLAFKNSKQIKKESEEQLKRSLAILKCLDSASRPDLSSKIISTLTRNDDYIKIKQDNSEEKTAFTEEDFQKFEREYFNN